MNEKQEVTWIEAIWGAVLVCGAMVGAGYAWLTGYIRGRSDGWNHALHTFTGPIPEYPIEKTRTDTAVMLKQPLEPTHPVFGGTPSYSNNAPVDNVIPFHLRDGDR